MSSLFLQKFSFPDEDREYGKLGGDYRSKMKCWDTMYPFGILSSRGLRELDFEPVTILYGLNGSGKSTALNIIAQRLLLPRDTLFNRSDFFDSYLDLCRYETGPQPEDSRIITSDDVFDYMLDIRTLNEGIDARREDLLEEYWDDRHAQVKVRSLADYDRLKKVNLARSKTPSRYLRTRLAENIREQSNGESAWFYFLNRVRDNGLYLLDEPENSLSPLKQRELAEYIISQARFFGCQFVISTHSPFLLSIPGARIYDLDGDPAQVRKWTELETVRAYMDLFRGISLDT